MRKSLRSLSIFLKRSLSWSYFEFDAAWSLFRWFLSSCIISCYYLMRYSFSSSYCLSIPSRWEAYLSWRLVCNSLLWEFKIFESSSGFASGDLFSSFVSIVFPLKECSLKAWTTTCFLFVWVIDSWVSTCRLLHPYLLRESTLCILLPWALSRETPVGLLLLGGTKLRV